MKGGLNKSFKNTVSQSLHAVSPEGLQRYVRTLFLIIQGTQRRKVSLTPQPIGHRTVVLTVLCLFVLGLFTSSAAKTRKKRKDTGDNRVYLLHSDELRYDQFGPNPDAQIVKGHVSFLHRGSHLTCDSAYFYQVSNSVRAFGHVRFRQGDTLSLVCDRAWYDGEGQIMEARSNVVLKHRGQTLYCDSLNYDRLYSNAYFFKGGRLVDKNSKLVVTGVSTIQRRSRLCFIMTYSFTQTVVMCLRTRCIMIHGQSWHMCSENTRPTTDKDNHKHQ